MVRNSINERIRVYAVYNEPRDRRAPHERLQPVAFCWRNRQYRVRDITYVWRESRGETELYHYAVTDGSDVYELLYETKSLDWTLSTVSCEE
ncbi:MAG: DUF6504 family protein [bacterium]